MTVSQEVISELLTTLLSQDNIKSVKFSDNQFYVNYNIDTGAAIYGSENPHLESIRAVLKKYNLEIGGLDKISNWEAYKKAEEEYKIKNPRPIDPSYQRDWFSHSYYWRTKGEGARLFDKYLKDNKEWHIKANAALPPRDLPGFCFDVQTLGENQKVFDFYANTNYWGD